VAVPRAQAKTSRRRRPASKRGMLAMVLALAKAPRRRRPGRKDLAAAALRAQAEARRTASTVRTEAARCPWRAPLRHGLQAPCLWCAGCGAGSLAGEPPPLGPCYGRVCFPMHGMHVGASCNPAALCWLGSETRRVLDTAWHVHQPAAKCTHPKTVASQAADCTWAAGPVAQTTAGAAYSRAWRMWTAVALWVLRELPCLSATTWKQWRLEAPASEARSARPVGQATVQQHAAWHRGAWPSCRPGVACLARFRGGRGRNSACPEACVPGLRARRLTSCGGAGEEACMHALAA